MIATLTVLTMPTKYLPRHTCSRCQFGTLVFFVDKEEPKSLLEANDEPPPLALPPASALNRSSHEPLAEEGPLPRCSSLGRARGEARGAVGAGRGRWWWCAG